MSNNLDVPGARLHYEVVGSGPLLMMIPGGNGAGDSFKPFSRNLTADYTIVTYDRRGYARSQLDGEQDYDQRLASDVDDVRRLIEHVGDGPVTIFGPSSGGIIALELFARHPSLVRTLIAYEPAALKHLPDGQDWVDFCGEVYDVYRESGMMPAFEKFSARILPVSDRPPTDASHAPSEQDLADIAYWFEHELRQYPAVELDLAALKAHAERLMLMCGTESRGYPAYEVNVELSGVLSRELIEMPGGHTGYVTEPEEFARRFTEVLAGATGAPNAT